MKSLILTIACFLAAPAWAYYDVLDSGEILPKENYKLTGSGQLLTDTGGVNAEIMGDAGFQDEFGLRGIFGFGKTDLFIGGMFKWMPVPDIDNQPAIGFNTGILYGKDGDTRDLTFRLEPLISKKFTTGDGTAWTPYASLPVGLRTRTSESQSNKSDLTWQIVAGTQLQVPKWKKLQFIGEVGVDLDHALSHVTVGAILYVDEENGFVIE